MRRNFKDPMYIEWRLKVFKRDGFKCQMPECKSKRRIQAHHIRTWASAPTLRFIPQNGITLCRTCHDGIKNKEQYYVGLFLQIVLDKEK